MTTYCINLANRAVTRYTNMDALAFERIGDKMYAVCSDGIYLIGNGETVNTTDNGAAIDAVVTFGMADFKERNLKRMGNVYVGAEGTCTIQFNLDGGDTTAEYDATHTGSGIGTRRIKVGKGHRSRYWQPVLRNVSGGNVEIDAIDLEPIVTGRGVS